MLLNLVSNAVKFARRGVPPVVVIEAQACPGGWRVSDNGIGVPESDYHAVFEPYHRMDHSGPGHDIGLSTVRRIVETHGGRVRLAGREDPGSTVWFELPSEVTATR